MNFSLDNFIKLKAMYIGEYLIKTFFTVIDNSFFTAYLCMELIRECRWPLISIISLFLLISQSKTYPIAFNSESQSYAE